MLSNVVIGWQNCARTTSDLQTYWLDENHQIASRGYSGSWGSQSIVAGPLTPCAQFCATQLGCGAEHRVYYQTGNSCVIQEVRNNGSGWFPGTSITTTANS